MKVVHLTENPIAGAPINLSLALNKYSEGRIKSRHIAASNNNENRTYNSDLLIGLKDQEEIFKVIKDCDIIHFHNFYRQQELFRQWPELWDEVMKKKRVWQAHTQRDIAWIDMNTPFVDLDCKKLVIAQYHPRMYPECEIVPNIIDIFDQSLMPISRANLIPHFVYSPSRLRLKGWDDKGYTEAYPVLQKLVDDGLISADIIHDRPYAECLSRKQKGDIALDEHKTGSYHLASLEALSLGLVTIAGLDSLQIKVLRDLTGSNKLPWVIARPDTLEQVIRDIASSQEFVEEAKSYSRKWMETYWHPKTHVNRFIKIYEGL